MRHMTDILRTFNKNCSKETDYLSVGHAPNGIEMAENCQLRGIRLFRLSMLEIAVSGSGNLCHFGRENHNADQDYLASLRVGYKLKTMNAGQVITRAPQKVKPSAIHGSIQLQLCR